MKEIVKEEVKVEVLVKLIFKKVKKEEILVIFEEKEVIFFELEFGSEIDDFIFIEDFFLEKIEFFIELFGKFEVIKVEILVLV